MRNIESAAMEWAVKNAGRPQSPKPGIYTLIGAEKRKTFKKMVKE